MKRLFFWLFILFRAVCFGQIDSAEHALFIKGGFSHYVYTVPAGVGGSLSSSEWKDGPTLGIGVRFPASRTISLATFVDYSLHRYKAPNGSRLLNNPKASIFDLSLSARYGRDIAYVMGGIGFSFARRDEAELSTPLDSMRTYQGTVEGGDDTSLFLNLGLGLQFRLANHMSVFIQGGARLRRYSSFTVESGIAWEF